jgi:FKBP-type peptidyl-prolyl cis-trans isomerase SlyD
VAGFVRGQVDAGGITAHRSTKNLQIFREKVFRKRTMRIEKDTVVTLKYKVSDAQGKLLEAAAEPMAYLHGGYENTLPKIEEALDGQEKGYQTTLVLSAEDSFGERDESLLQTMPKKDFPPGVKVGGQLRGRTADGREAIFNVVKIKGDTVMLDGNHPWAGQTLRFQLNVIDVRAAIQEEIEHRHVHGAHGHHH